MYDEKQLKSMSQDNRVLWWLENIGQINPLDAWQHLGIYRLGACIERLRKSGIEIETRREKAYNKFNESCNFGMYELMRYK